MGRGFSWTVNVHGWRAFVGGRYLWVVDDTYTGVAGYMIRDVLTHTSIRPIH